MFARLRSRIRRLELGAHLAPRLYWPNLWAGAEGITADDSGIEWQSLYTRPSRTHAEDIEDAILRAGSTNGTHRNGEHSNGHTQTGNA